MLKYKIKGLGTGTVEPGQNSAFPFVLLDCQHPGISAIKYDNR